MPVATSDETKAVVRYYLGHVRRYPRYLSGLLAALPLTVLIHQFIPPLILADVLGRLSRHDYRPHDVWGSFGIELVAYTVLVMFGGMLAWRIVDYFAWRLEAHIQRAIARQVFDHLGEQSANFHADNFGGSLVSKTNKLLASYVRLADTTIFQVLPLLCSLLFAIIILSRRAPLFVVALTVFAIGFMISAVFITRASRRYSAEHASRESDQTGYLADAITNVMAIKSFAGGRYERRAFGRVTNRTKASLDDLSVVFMRQLYIFTGVTNGIMAMSLTLAVVSVLLFDANIGTVFLILNYTGSIAGQLFVFSNNALRNYNRSFGEASDMVAILAQPADIQDPIKPEKVRIRRGRIQFKDVSFSHDKAGDNLFDTLNLTVKAGEKVGLVGRSGSGKTTLIRLLLRFSDVDGGAITIDGQNIAHLKQDDLRRHIAYVPQEPLLFHRSLKENIRYGQAGANDQTVYEAAKLAHADDFIQLLPDKYDTLVGERGVKLSGGQRQRVAIARALIKNAPVLLLDEATSALDSESEQAIQAALWQLMEGRTAIVVAHRLSTIQQMDRIVVMNDGRIIEQGSHRQLLRAGGTYADLWNRQSGGFIED